MAFAREAAPLWEARDLAPIWRHLMASPLAGVLRACDAARWAAVLSRWSAAGTCSFGGLATDPGAPAEVFALAKDYAKAQVASPDPLLPPDVGTALYLFACAAALLQGHGGVSSLRAADFGQACESMAAQGWLDETARHVLRRAARETGA